MREEANNLINEIDAYLNKPINQETAVRLTENKTRILDLIDKVERKEFSAAFIGKIGAGKTSAICKLAGLQYVNSAGKNVELLKTGAGRTTVCEVRIEISQRYSIKIEPVQESEIKKLVSNFAQFIWAKAKKNVSDDDEGGNILSEELTRCIRHMLGLTIERKKIDKKWISTDKAIEFCNDCKSVEEVYELMFGCLDLDNRTETELWPNPEEAKNWQDWLKDTFSKVNDGKHKSVSIPSLITVCGPFEMNYDNSTWSIIDTRGIDSFIHREDIRQILDTEGIFPVICSSFVDAPDADCRSFYGLCIELGLRHQIDRDVTLLILDKDESDKIADIDSDIENIGDRKDIGRSIREGQVSDKIFNEHKLTPNILTFDSRLDSELDIWNALKERKDSYLNSKTNELNTLFLASRELISAEANKAEQFEREIESVIVNWRTDADSRAPDWSHFGDYIKKIFSDTHHRTLAASIDRKGTWYNLNVYEAINQRARSSAVDLCSKESAKIKDSLSLIKNKYPEFSNQVDTEEEKYLQEFDSFAMSVGNLARDHWVEQVKSFVSIWQKMAKEWGLGPGYKNRVIDLWDDWVKSDESKEIHHRLLRRIASSWGRVLSKRHG